MKAREIMQNLTDEYYDIIMNEQHDTLELALHHNEKIIHKKGLWGEHH
jgi:hypothetical protein